MDVHEWDQALLLRDFSQVHAVCRACGLSLPARLGRPGMGSGIRHVLSLAPLNMQTERGVADPEEREGEGSEDKMAAVAAIRQRACRSSGA